jgi:hypothetical protein
MNKDELKEYRYVCKIMGIPREDQDAFIRQLNAAKKAKKFGRMGGNKRKQNLSAKRRKQIAVKAAKTRWAKKKNVT